MKTKITIKMKGGPGSGDHGHVGRPGMIGGSGGSALPSVASMSINIDGTFPSEQSVHGAVDDGMLEYDEEYTLSIGGFVYEIRTEGWWPDCLESRGLCTTSKSSVQKRYLDIMKRESSWDAVDIHGYLPDADQSPDFGVSYIGRKIARV